MLSPGACLPGTYSTTPVHARRSYSTNVHAQRPDSKEHALAGTYSSRSPEYAASDSTAPARAQGNACVRAQGIALMRNAQLIRKRAQGNAGACARQRTTKYMKACSRRQ